MGERSKPERVPAEALHAGDEVIIPKDGGHVVAKILYSAHGTDAVSNIAILTCETDEGARLTLPFPSTTLIARVRANTLAAA
jgi:hydrogenase maturation factor